MIQGLRPFQKFAGGWLLSYGGEGVLPRTVSRTEAAAQLGAPLRSLRIEVERPGEGWFGLEQHLPGVADLVGRRVSLALTARASRTLTGNVGLLLDLGTGAPRHEFWIPAPKIDTAWSSLLFEFDVLQLQVEPGAGAYTIIHLGLNDLGAYWIEVGDVSLHLI